MDNIVLLYLVGKVFSEQVICQRERERNKECALVLPACSPLAALALSLVRPYHAR